MTIAALRDKLHNYIDVADDKKIKAIYMILEGDIEQKSEWWKDDAFVEELDERYEKWQKGEEKAYSIDEIKASVSRLKAKRKAK